MTRPECPRRIKIGGVSWRVRFRKLPWPLFGETSIRHSFININRRASRGQQRDTTVHELLHALISNAPTGLSAKAEERLIVAISPQLLAVLRDNPRLVEYLTASDN